MKITDFEKLYKDYFPVGQGWKKLVLKLVKNLIKIDPEIEVMQVKEKFGGLRFYINGVTRKNVEEVYRLITEAEIESYYICENCGTKDKVTTKPICGWLLTLCSKCRKEREKSNS